MRHGREQVADCIVAQASWARLDLLSVKYCKANLAGNRGTSVVVFSMVSKVYIFSYGGLDVGLCTAPIAALSVKLGSLLQNEA